MLLRRSDKQWRKTSAGEPFGYIDADGIRELWFHTGTICNLSCPWCFEHSAPGDTRLEAITLEDVIPFFDEAAQIGVEQICFTGGEPFVNRDLLRILDTALEQFPCLVLTNGTRPLLQCMEHLLPLRQKPHPLSFRVSVDFPDAARHDAGRGKGMFARALESLQTLHGAGFHVSVARHIEEGENTAAVEAAYRRLFDQTGLPVDLPLIGFPDLETITGPDITEHCMTTYQTAETRARFMCAFSRMIVKKEGRMRVLACTLVDDDGRYDFGGGLTQTIGVRVMLAHRRCFACFFCGTSCSER